MFDVQTFTQLHDSSLLQTQLKLTKKDQSIATYHVIVSGVFPSHMGRVHADVSVKETTVNHPLYILFEMTCVQKLHSSMLLTDTNL